MRGPNDWGRQVICYETGDYSGPHNDHHPQNEDERNGCWIRIAMTFNGDANPSDTTTWTASVLGDPVRLVE